MHSPAWIEARTLRLPGDTAPVELNAHPRVCMIQCTKSVRLTFPVTVLRFFYPRSGQATTGKYILHLVS